MTNTSIPSMPAQPSPSPSVGTPAPQTTPQANQSSSSPEKKRRKLSPQIIFGGTALFVLILGSIVGFVLMSRNNDIRQQASGPGTYPTCAGGVQAGQRACDTFRSYVTCGYEGQFGESTPCPGNSTCSGGVCADRTWCDRSIDSACADVAAGTSCGSGRTCVVINAGGANTDCLCQGSGTGTTPQPTPTSGQCVSAGGSCSIGGSGASTCCSGLVCQNGVTGQLRCEDPGTTDLCPGGGTCGGAGGWLGFRCNQLTNGQCLENGQTFNDYASAAAYAGGCGQVDEVCVGGSNNRNLCGSFQIFSSSCGGSPSVPPSTPPSAPPSVPPSATPSPGVTPSPGTSPSPSPALACMYIVTNATNIRVGDDVTFTCGSVAGATAYEFRVRLPNGSFQPLAASATGSNISAPFSVETLGDYRAQCRICTGPQQTCQEWEAL